MKELLLTALGVMLTATMTASERVNLDSLYQVLDEAIAQSDVYQKKKLSWINELKTDFTTAKNDMDRYEAARKLYREYCAFCNDSAIKYIEECMDCADRMNRPDLKALSELGLAYQLADTGFYPEAYIHFQNIPKDQLKGDLELTYLSGLNHLYGEMGYYSHDPKLSRQFHDRSDVIRDSLMSLYQEGSRGYVALRSMVLNNQGKPDEALPYSDQWLKFVEPDTRAFAIMAFFRSEIYKTKGDVEMQRYWLIQSALTDVRSAIMDQAALWSLANSLIQEDEDGEDLDRAYRYMDFSWGCISQFSTHMRSWLVSPILTRINDKYKARLHAANTRLQWAVVGISLLALGLLLLFVYVSKKRKQLAKARNELKASNDQLSELNMKLSNVNTQLLESNVHLHDSNRVKDEYITKFLQLCSEYIDKLDNYRIKVNRKVKAGQIDDLRKLTSSSQMKEDEVKELFDNFDAVFLNLFPNFVDEFNALLKPEERIVLPEEGHLTTDLRIFALIRLGIDESSRIADFLRYSPNSIYNYRARIKNKAIGDREDFERQVKEIGL